jgi:hypothetical protein
MPNTETPKSRRLPHWAWVTLGVITSYLLVAYVILPQLGKQDAKRHPDLVDGARLTHTKSGIPGDPLNIALVGTLADVVAAMTAAGWRAADALGLRSDERIVVDTILDQPDPSAPVSNLYLFGRKEDLAFEKPIGHSPRERNHVRFWRSEQTTEGRPIWIGAATRDVRVELSSNTKEITHRISPDVDAERDLLLDEITKANHATGTRWIDGFHRELRGRNGGGDPWQTDGRLPIASLSVAGSESKP